MKLVSSVETNEQQNSLVVSSLSLKRKQLKKFYLTEDDDKNNFVFLDGKRILCSSAKFEYL